MRGSVEVRMIATDMRSKLLPQVRQAGEVTMRGSARSDLARRLHVLTRAKLQPGRYQLRIAVGTTSAEAAWSTISKFPITRRRTWR
jgi:hypothetical protein